MQRKPGLAVDVGHDDGVLRERRRADGGACRERDGEGSQS